MTAYKILANTDDGGPRWQEIAEYEGASGQAAIRAYLKDSEKNKMLVEDSNGTYVAIPARSWQPVKVQVETALKFSS